MNRLGKLSPGPFNALLSLGGKPELTRGGQPRRGAKGYGQCRACRRRWTARGQRRVAHGRDWLRSLGRCPRPARKPYRVTHLAFRRKPSKLSTILSAGQSQAAGFTNGCSSKVKRT
jgi:hypothetical protein